MFQRDARRRKRRSAVIAAAAVAGAAVLSAAAILTWRSDRQAKDSLTREKTTAADVISLREYLGDELSIGVRRSGQLALLEQVARKSLEFAGAADTPAQRREAARHERTLGDVALQRGDPAAAKTNFVASLERIADDQTPEGIIDRASLLNRIAVVDRKEGHLDAAIDGGRAALDLVRPLVASDDATDQARFQMASFAAHLSDSLTRRQAFDAIEALATEALSVLEGATGDGRSRWRAIVLRTRGVARVRSGNPEAAKQDLHLSVREAQAHLALDPNDVARIQALANSLLRRTEVTELPEEKLRGMEAAHKLTSQLAQLEPDNLEWLHDLSQSHTRLGTLHWHAKRYADARTHFTSAEKFARAAVERLPSDARLQNSLMGSLTHVGNMSRLLGASKQANTSLKEALEIGERAAKEHPDDLRVRQGFATTLLYYGLAIQKDRPDAALTAFGRSALLFEELSKDLPLLAASAKTVRGLIEQAEKTTGD